MQYFSAFSASSLDDVHVKTLLRGDYHRQYPLRRMNTPTCSTSKTGASFTRIWTCLQRCHTNKEPNLAFLRDADITWQTYSSRADPTRLPVYSLCTYLCILITKFFFFLPFSHSKLHLKGSVYRQRSKGDDPIV